MTLGEKVKRGTVIVITTGFGAGYFPFASGTVGSAVAIAGLWLAQPSTLWIVGLAIGLLLIGAWASDKASQVFNKVDSSEIVIDEIVGVLITMIGIPLTNFWLVVGFFLFRVFDIFKPPPASYMDSKIKNGWGVMLDDVVAGIYANAIMHLLIQTGLLH